MKQFLYRTTNNVLFWEKTNISSLKRCMSLYRSCVSSINTPTLPRNEVFSKLSTKSKKEENVSMKKRFFSDFHKELILMDFDVWPQPKFFRSFRAFYYLFFVLKGMDSAFSASEFNQSAAIALQVVTNLLSELRFSELEGLLTQECKEEVEKNLKCWSRDEISVLAVSPEKIMRNTPCDVTVFSDENNKVFVEVRVIYYVWMKYSSKFKRAHEFFKSHDDILNHSREGNFNNVHMFGIYNSKFIREFTQGVIDQWTINAINFKCNTDLLMTS